VKVGDGGVPDGQVAASVSREGCLWRGCNTVAGLAREQTTTPAGLNGPSLQDFVS